jgi:hypothetical protein
MNELNRRKSYLYAIENHAGTPPFSNVKLAHITYMVSLQIGDKKCPSLSRLKRWYKEYKFDKRLVTSQNQGRLTCNY